jgi:peptidoglycan/LPS O-acetylase OafA/YrhL
VTDVAERPRRGRYAVLAAGLLAVLAAFWLPRWWESRLYRQAEALTGVGARILPGSLTEARKKVDPGRASRDVLSALGNPSLSAATAGASRHEIWTYYYADGTMTVNLTDGYVVRVAVSYGPPMIPTSRRP